MKIKKYNVGYFLKSSYFKQVLSLLLIAYCSLEISLSQTKIITLEQAKQLALQNNQQLIAGNLKTDFQKALKKGATEIPKTDVSLLYGQTNSIEKNDNNISITQTFPFPTVFSANSALANANIKSAELKTAATKSELIYQVKQVFTQLQFLYLRKNLLQKQDSIYQGFYNSSSLRYKTGETNLLEKTTAETQLFEVKNLIRQNEADIAISSSQLKTLIGIKEEINLNKADLTILHAETFADSLSPQQNPSLIAAWQEVEIARKEQKVASAQSLPDITLGYFNQSLIGTQIINGQDVFFGGSKRFQGFQVGLAVPLFYGSYQSKIKSAGINRQITEANSKLFESKIKGAYQEALQEFLKNKETVEYYQKSALPNADLILKNSALAYKGGDMSYNEYLLNLKNVNIIRENHLKALLNLNQSVNNLSYLQGNQ